MLLPHWKLLFEVRAWMRNHGYTLLDVFYMAVITYPCHNLDALSIKEAPGQLKYDLRDLILDGEWMRVYVMTESRLTVPCDDEQYGRPRQ